MADISSTFKPMLQATSRTLFQNAISLRLGAKCKQTSNPEKIRELEPVLLSRLLEPVQTTLPYDSRDYDSLTVILVIQAD